MYETVIFYEFAKMVIVKSFSYLSLVTGLLINVLSVDGSAADTDAMEGVL